MLVGFRYIKIRPTLTVSVFLLQRCLEFLGYSRNAVAIPSSKGPSSDELGGFASFTSDIGGLKKVVSFIKALECDVCVTHIVPITYFPLWTMGSLFSNYEETTKQIDSKQDDMRKLPNSRWMVTQRKPQKKSRVVSTSFNTSLEDECQCGSSLHVQGEKWKPFETDSQCRGLKPSLGLKLQQQWIPKQISNPVLTTKNRDILVDIPIFCWWYSHC